MKNPLHPADELAEIRSEIARLRLRESQLRRMMLEGPADLRAGRWFQVELREIIAKRLDLAKLPEAVLQNAGHFCDIRRTILHCRAKPLSSLLRLGPLFPAPDRLQ